jgi:hypothetical protein
MLGERGRIDLGNLRDGDEGDLGDRRCAFDQPQGRRRLGAHYSAVEPAWARRLAKAIENQAACAAAVKCSGFDAGPPSKRDLYV